VCSLRYVSPFESLQRLPDCNQTWYERNDNGSHHQKKNFMKLVPENEARILTATSFRVLV